MLDSIVEFIKKVIYLLPSDPFTEYIDNASLYFSESNLLGYINYFIPVNMFVAISKRWIVAVGIYIVVRTIVKGLKGEK